MPGPVRPLLILAALCASAAPAPGAWYSGRSSYYYYPTYYSGYSSYYYPTYYSGYSSYYYPTYYVGGTSYYYPAYHASPVYYYTPTYTPVACPVTTAVTPAVSTYATPTPAPPSQTPEPPTKRSQENGPKVQESRSYTRNYYTADRDGERCRVGFWNRTGRDVTVLVDGRGHFVPRDGTLSLDVAREFAWRFDQHDPQTARVPAERSTLEILLRE